MLHRICPSPASKLTSRSILRPWWYTSVSKVIRCSSSVTIREAWERVGGGDTVHQCHTEEWHSHTQKCALHRAVPDQLQKGSSSGSFNPRCQVDSWALSGVPELHGLAAAHPGCPHIIWSEFWIPWAFLGDLLPSTPEESLRKRGETQILRITFPALPSSDATAICLPSSSFLSFSIQVNTFTPLTYNTSVGACESDTGDPGPMHAFVTHFSHPHGCKHLWFIHFTVTLVVWLYNKSSILGGLNLSCLGWPSGHGDTLYISPDTHV